jgi:hypothetical protein
MPIVRCTSCQTDNELELTGALCRNCGALLPSLAQGSDSPLPPSLTVPPAVINSPETQFRQELINIQEKQRFARRGVSTLLFALAGVQLACGCADLIGTQDPAKGQPSELRLIFLTVLAIALLIGAFVLAGLGWWALYQPLPASLVGLGLWGVLSAISNVLVPEAICRIGFVNGPLMIALGQGGYASYKAFYKRPSLLD